MNWMLCNVKGWWTRFPNWGKGRARGAKDDAIRKFIIDFLLALHINQIISCNRFGTTQMDRQTDIITITYSDLMGSA